MKPKTRTALVIAAVVAVCLVVAAIGYSLGATQPMTSDSESVSGGMARLTAPSRERSTTSRPMARHHPRRPPR